MRQEEVRILIAERNPRIRNFLSREFLNRAFRVEGAGNSDEVLKAVKSSEPPHLIILDASTPDNTGGVLLQLLGYEFPEVPIILHGYLSDLTDDVDLRQVFAMVDKDGSPDELTSTVLRAIDRLYPVSGNQESRNG